MRKWLKIILIGLLLAGVAVLCIVRWQAWFGMPAEPEWTGDTLSYSFPAADETLCQQEQLTILVLGDIHNRLTRADYNLLANRVPKVDAVAQVGDWLDRGQEYYYQLLLREWMPSALCGLPVIACPGNHEYSKDVPKQLSPVWSKAFSVPDNGPANVRGVSYYIDMAHVRFIVLDTNPLDHLVYLTRTLTWLRTLIDSAGDRYIVVMMHHPVLSAGKGRFNALIYASFRHALGEADLVIAGHDHSYMRTRNFVVLNAAGVPKKQQTILSSDVSDVAPVYGVLTVEQSQMQFNVYHFNDGQLIDSLHVQHD